MMRETTTMLMTGMVRTIMMTEMILLVKAAQARGRAARNPDVARARLDPDQGHRQGRGLEVVGPAEEKSGAGARVLARMSEDHAHIEANVPVVNHLHPEAVGIKRNVINQHPKESLVVFFFLHTSCNT